eukprot:CAMPEP_0203765162 /NCGR_PEP_ID=MMETSP0098-20131031/18260_1 /ASSEMBLY_ACC=CAM_ASM_000208 /TAXON_ID=96639 /ORGANISM=" , Strain NY0313808BC1" /LENGTH=726 /DNA_ID=CAMNT_0050661389 /DNA_START=97 /DNA_END=2277 /DNA_ORIENTATION=+
MKLNLARAVFLGTTIYTSTIHAHRDRSEGKEKVEICHFSGGHRELAIAEQFTSFRGFRSLKRGDRDNESDSDSDSDSGSDSEEEDELQYKTIRVSRKAAAKHVAKHGDLVGSCNDWCETICNDTNACTVDANPGDDCEANGCTPIADRAPTNCDDGDACTNDGCDPLTGCTREKVVCDDGNACTHDGCDPLTGCVTKPVNCDDGNACTHDGCDPLTGCVTKPVNCDDGNACTHDGCDPLTGCVTKPVNCDDGNACTNDYCDPIKGCYTKPKSCDDGNACTNDHCDPLRGCFTKPVNCDDGDACTNDHCDPLRGCFTKPVNCDDGNACTNDHCDPLKGCFTKPVSCDDGDACTNDHCDPLRGCFTKPVNCDDGNACTNDHCDPLRGCFTKPVNCDDGNACTNDHCDPLKGCFTKPVKCDDGNACTNDYCDPLKGCYSNPVDCGSGASCDPDTGACVDDTPIVDVSNCENCDADTANCQKLANGEYKCVCNIGFTDFGSGCVPTPNENCYNTPSSSRLWTAPGNTCGVKSSTPNVLLFNEDFERYPNGQNLPASTGWVGKNGADYANDNLSPYPRYSPIPNDPHGQALTFRRLNAAGDIFSIQTVACPSGKYCYLVFDYLTLCRSPNANNQRSGICFGYAQAYPGVHNWYCDASYNNVLPTKAGSWVRCRMPWNFRSPYRVMLEDYSGVPEDIIYDNIRIIQSDTPQSNCCEVLDLSNYVDSLTDSGL